MLDGMGGDIGSCEKSLKEYLTAGRDKIRDKMVSFVP